MIDRRSFTAGALGGLAVLAAAPSWGAGLAELARPGDPGRGRSFGTTLDDLAAFDYVEEEVFLTGLADSYVPQGEQTPDGRWTVAAGEPREFASRLLVRRPRDAAKASGTVVVEWLNVSFGFDMSFADAAALWRAGHCWVGVSAQAAGVNGFEDQPQGLRTWDSSRYGCLKHPGDDWSYGVFTAAARALRANRGRGHPLHGIRLRHLVGVGASQSGSRILTYANAVQPTSGAFDALMPLICAGAAAPFTGTVMSRSARGARPVFSHVRSDASTPVLQINSECEAGFFRAIRQPDSGSYRSWEVAGASHGPTEQLRAVQAKERRDGVVGPWHDWDESSDVAWLPVFSRALSHVIAWLEHKSLPPEQEPIAFAEDGRTILRDDCGNARGGVRLPELEAPVASYRGLGARYMLAGETHPFGAARLREIYGDHAQFVARREAAAAAAVRSGVIDHDRAAVLGQWARAFDFPAA